jgi:hypothetical protein
MKERLSPLQLFQRILRESIHRRDGKQNTEYIGGGDLVEVYVRTLCADCNWDQQRLSELEYESFWTGELPPSYAIRELTLYREGIVLMYSLHTM